MSLFPGKFRYENEEHDNLGVDWVIQYQFEDVGEFPIPSLSCGNSDLEFPPCQTKHRQLKNSAPSSMIWKKWVSEPRSGMAMVLH